MRENKGEGRKRESETEVTSCINDEERKMLRAINLERKHLQREEKNGKKGIY